MCLSTFTPAMSRMRHWSCPERLGDLAARLPASCLDVEDPEIFLPPARTKEAEDLRDPGTYDRVELRVRVLAAWEERVLSLRQTRRPKPRPEPSSSVTFVKNEVKEDCVSGDVMTTPVRPPGSPSSPPPPDCESVKLNLRISHRKDSSATLSPEPLSVSLQGGAENTCPGNPSLSESAFCHGPTQRPTNHGPVSSTRDHSRPFSGQRLVTPLTYSRSCDHSRPIEDHYPAPLNTLDQSKAGIQVCHSSKCSYKPRLWLHPPARLLLFLCHLLPGLLSLCSSGIIGAKSRELRSKKPPDKQTRFARTPVTVGRVSPSLWVTCLLLSLASPGKCINVDDRYLSESFGQVNEGPVCADGIYRGNININNKDEDTGMASLVKYENCSVVEGSISITSAVYEMKGFGNYSLPNLVEVTDFVLLYRADEVDSLESIFPRLSVIRGHKLVQFYALAIYQMKNMVRVGLPSLTHIMNGGVRIEKNPLLCYVDTIDWKKIVVQENDKNSHIEIIDNQSPNNCLDKCPAKCSDDGCWSSTECQRVIVPCPEGTDFKDQMMCTRSTRGEEGRPCHPECISGCEDTEDAVSNPGRCVACNHTRSGAGLEFTCLSSCPRGMVAYKQWMCITETECSNRQVFEFPTLISQDQAKSVYKVHGGKCLDKCPSAFKPVKVGDIWECAKCLNGDCPVHCDGEIINSPESAKKLKSCTHINGVRYVGFNSGSLHMEEVDRTNFTFTLNLMGLIRHELSQSFFLMRNLLTTGSVPSALFCFRSVC